MMSADTADQPSSSELPDIRKAVLEFHHSLLADKYHRYRSWEHCYAHFRKHSQFMSVGDVDFAALHLGFYLASWGMYRSNFLLWKDYRVHVPIVQELLKEEYLPLWDIDWEQVSNNELDAIIKLGGTIRRIYQTENPTVNEELNRVSVTNILLTKILMGTFGCVPAFDRYVVAGGGCLGFDSLQFQRQTLVKLKQFCDHHAKSFKVLQNEIRADGYAYPTMKLVDMYLWIIGRNREEQEKSKVPKRAKKQVIARSVGPISSTSASQEEVAGHWSGRKRVKEIVREAVLEVTQGSMDRCFTMREVIQVVLAQYPQFNENTVRCQIISDCVNHSSKHHYSGGREYYRKIERGLFQLLAPESLGCTRPTGWKR